MKPSTLTLTLLFVLSALFIAACSGSPTPASPEAPASTEPPAAPTSAPATPTTAPTNTSAPESASGDACVVGAWTLSDMSAYMSSIMQQAEGASFEPAGQEGEVRYVFNVDGTLSFEANNFVVRFAISVSGVSFDLAVTMDGSGTGTYNAGAGSLTIAGSDVESMRFSATLGGTELFSSTSGELASLFGASAEGSSTFPYTCAGDTLTYTPPVDLEGVQPVVLSRVSP
jgi:hypothetical protein